MTVAGLSGVDLYAQDSVAKAGDLSADESKSSSNKKDCDETSSGRPASDCKGKDGEIKMRVADGAMFRIHNKLNNVENYDVTDLIQHHSDYSEKLPLILNRIQQALPDSARRSTVAKITDKIRSTSFKL